MGDSHRVHERAVAKARSAAVREPVRTVQDFPFHGFNRVHQSELVRGERVHGEWAGPGSVDQAGTSDCVSVRRAGRPGCGR